MRLELVTTDDDDDDDELPSEAVSEADEPKRFEAAVKTEERAEETAAGRNCSTVEATADGASAVQCKQIRKREI